MFAYCLNNPTNRTDASGLLSTKLITIAAKAIVGGIVNAVCEFAVGGSLKDVALGFVDGMVGGALSELFDFVDGAISIFNAVNTVVECYNSGASFGSSLLAGTVELLCSMVYLSDIEPLLECVVDLTFGLGLSLVSTGISEGIKKNANKEPVEVLTFSPTPITPETIVTPPKAAMSDYTPAYNGFGFSSLGHTHGGYKIPIIKGGCIL